MSLHVELVLVLQGLAADTDQSQQQLRARLARPPHRGSIDRTSDGWRLCHLMAGTCSRHGVSVPLDVEVVHSQPAPSAGETPARLCNLPTPTIAFSQVPRPLQSRRSPLPATFATRPRERLRRLRSQAPVSQVKGLPQDVVPLEARRQRQGGWARTTPRPLHAPPRHLFAGARRQGNLLRASPPRARLTPPRRDTSPSFPTYGAPRNPARRPRARFSRGFSQAPA